MAYTVLARRYRSRSFDEVVGQETIARTLANAIERDRVGHAYLFTGTRGVGKTSMARIFAKALNAPGDEPRDVADAIMQGRDTDVIEIDAASNRGVDEARELIANSVYRPMRGRYKVYIIDEVHMLTREAFNALLKTMEEPPSHVKFILCTTEAHKVPPTIQSRCQRFDFRNIDTRRIAEHLRAVLKGEGVEADASVVAQIARLGNGSMRDALTLLDRLLATGERTLTAALLQEVLGLPQIDVVDGVLEASAQGGVKEALEAADRLLRSGVTIDQAFESIETRLRDLLILAACGPESDIVELDGDDRARAAALAAHFDPASITHMIALCENAARSAKSSGTPRALFDAVIARMALTERVADAMAVLRAAPGAHPATTGALGGPPKKPQAPVGGEPAEPAHSGFATPSRAPFRAPPAPSPAPAPSAPPGRHVFAGPHPGAQAPPPGRPIPPDQRMLTVAEREALEHPLVRTAVDLFGARLVRVETDTRDDLAAPDAPPKEE